jgi:multicomponent Na+:H+ antiporter subunit E
LANAITLTPGTLTVDAHEDELFIHWIDVSGSDVDEFTRAIVAGFERHLEVIFG